MRFFHKCRYLGILLMGAILFVPPSWSEEQTGGSSAEKTQFYPLDQVRAGQKGIGLTTLEGDKIQEFEVEILGVLENFAPQRNAVLARLSGGGLEHTGVLAGMSGSPVYIDGKLLGAVAFAFPFSKEPIAGITPIAEMINVVPEEPEEGTRRASLSASTELIARVPNLSTSGERQDVRWIPPREDSPSPLKENFSGANGRPSWLRIPLVFNGFSESLMEGLTPEWRALGFEPMIGGGSLRTSEEEPARLQPGSMVSIHLVRGDLNTRADCTVTHREGDRLYACGHSLLAAGGMDMPFSASKVLTVVPSLRSSFKISAAGPPLGAIRQDRSGGVYGVMGEQARMIPVRVKLDSTLQRNKEYNVEIVQNPFLTPFLLNQVLMNIITATERRLGHSTFEIQGKIRLGRGQSGEPGRQGDNDASEINAQTVYRGQTVEFEDIVSGEMNSQVAAASVVTTPLRALLASGYDDLVIEGIDVSVVSTEERRSASLEQVWSSKSVVKPGEEIVIHGTLRTPGGETTVERIPVVIPESVADGYLSIVVGSGVAINRFRSPRLSALRGRPAKDLRQLVRALNRLRRNNRLYVLLLASKRTLFLQGEEFPSPPPSLIQTFLSDPAVSTDMATSRYSIIGDSEGSPQPFSLRGQRTIRVRVGEAPSRSR